MNNVVEMPLEPECPCDACGAVTFIGQSLKVKSPAHGILNVMICSDCALGHTKELFTLALNYITQLEDRIC